MSQFAIEMYESQLERLFLYLYEPNWCHTAPDANSVPSFIYYMPRIPPCRCRVSNKSPDQCSEISKHQLRNVALPASHRGTRRASAQHRIPQSGLHLPMLLRPKHHQSRIQVNLRETTNFMGRCVTHGITLSVKSKIFSLRDSSRGCCNTSKKPRSLQGIAMTTRTHSTFMGTL